MLVKAKLIDLGEVQPIYQDMAVTLGFLRKFFFSLGHLIVLFALMHYLAAVVQGLAISTGFRTAWMTLTYDAALALVGAVPEPEAATHLSRALVAFNVYAGVTLLVLLVTTFSMMTRERARAGLGELVKRIESAVMTLEWHFVAAAVQATRNGAMTKELSDKLKKVDRFALLPESSVNAFQAVVAMDEVFRRASIGPEVDAARLLAHARQRFDVEDYSKLMRAGNVTSRTAPSGATCSHVAEPAIPPASRSSGRGHVAPGIVRAERHVDGRRGGALEAGKGAADQGGAVGGRHPPDARRNGAGALGGDQVEDDADERLRLRRGLQRTCRHPPPSHSHVSSRSSMGPVFRPPNRTTRSRAGS